MRNIGNKTLFEIRQECLTHVTEVNNHNLQLNIKIGCKDHCKLNCIKHKIGWFPGQWILNIRDENKEELK